MYKYIRLEESDVKHVFLPNAQNYHYFHRFSTGKYTKIIGDIPRLYHHQSPFIGSIRIDKKM